MAGWLVRSRIQAEVEHHGALVFRSVNIGSTIGVSHVIAEESALELLEDVNSVGDQLQSIDGFGSLWVDITTGSRLGGESLVLDRGDVKGNGIISHDITSGNGRNIENLVSHESKSMPITVLVDIGGGNVDERTETGVDSLDRPLELRQENGIG